MLLYQWPASVSFSSFPYQILQLTSGLFDLHISTVKDNGHTTEILYLCVGYNKRFNVETTSSQDTRHTTQNTRFVLNQAIQDMASLWLEARSRCVVENVGYCILDGRLRYNRDRSKTTLTDMLLEGNGRCSGTALRGQESGIVDDRRTSVMHLCVC